MRITVQAGETLGAIAQRFGTTVGELQQLNDILDADHLSAGHRLKNAGPPKNRGLVRDGRGGPVGAVTR